VDATGAAAYWLGAPPHTPLADHTAFAACQAFVPARTIEVANKDAD
jgi:hypothetical protein